MLKTYLILIGILSIHIVVSGCIQEAGQKGPAKAIAIVVTPGQSIQKAIDAARPGDITEVQNGTYHESVNVTKRLILRGISGPVVDADYNGSAIAVLADSVVLEGFTAIHAKPDNAGVFENAGIYVKSSNNFISGNSVRDRNGIILFESSNNIVTGNNGFSHHIGIVLPESDNNTIKGNNVSAANYGLIIDNSNNNTLIENNATDSWYGIQLSSSNNNNVTRNNLGNNEVRGITLWASSDNSLVENNARYCEGGISRRLQ